MHDVALRKLATFLEEVHHEGGPPAATPLLRAAAIAVIQNPFAGLYVEDIQPFMEPLKPLGLMMAQRLIDMLGGDPAVVQGYGKGAIIGTSGEIELGALWHAPGGYAMRELLGRCDGNRAVDQESRRTGKRGWMCR